MSLFVSSQPHTNQVFYGHLLGFKGLERRAVVLAVNQASHFDRSRERLYVGLSRARDQLVVCGDPDLIRGVGGLDLAPVGPAVVVRGSVLGASPAN
jgi:hypothetical protein